MDFRTPSSRIAQKLTMTRIQSNGDFLDGALATGSYWLDDNAWYLITNWHNVTGCHPVTHEAMSPETGFLPTHVKFSYVEADKVENIEGQYVLKWGAKIAPLYDSDNNPLWLEHPRYGHAVDVVALKLFVDSAENANIFSMPINKHPNWFAINLAPGDDCFVLGYPKNLDAGFHLPLWKRASIASEPSIDHGGLPKLLIDAATRQGMSGAPVIAVSNGYHVPIDGKGVQDGVLGRVKSFVGIYSGRTDDDQLGVQIGVVWKASVIEEILRGKVTGSNPLAP